MFEEQIKREGGLALEALSAARKLRDETKAEDWTAEHQSTFDKAMADWSDHHDKVVEFRRQQEQQEQLDAAWSDYGEPASKPLPKSETTENLQSVEREKHRKAYRKYLYAGDAALDMEERRKYLVRVPTEGHALVSTQDNLGGFLVPDDDQDELIKEVAGFAVIRPVARVRPTTRGAASFMTVAGGTDPYPSGVSGSWKAEGFVTGGTAPATQDQPTFGRERVPVHLWSPDAIEITPELLEDSAIDLDAEVRQLLAETRALDEDSAFINGSGVGLPEGLINSGASTVQSGAAGGQSYDGLVNLFTNLKPQYRGRPGVRWLMNSLTWGLILQLKDSQNMPIFPVNQLITQLFGKDIIFSEFMADGNTDNNKAIVFGDFSFYGIADRRDLRVQRLTERYAPNIAFLASARVGGQTLVAAAFRIQNVGA